MNTLEQFLLSLNNIPRIEYMRDPKHCDVYLKRLQFFLDILGNPEKQIPHYIHITGTSGKGSVCEYIACGLQSGGHRVGIMTSPHPSDITERFCVNGAPMTKKEQLRMEQTIKTALDQYMRTSPYDMLSFFEITTAIGLLHFTHNKVTHAVIEVGCGGRFDSTNIIPHKDIAIITNIGLDHVGIIGNNKAEIAYEKSGIIKSGCTVFTAEKNKALRSIMQHEADSVHAPLHYIQPHYEIKKQTAFATTYIYNKEIYTIPSASPQQIDNAILSIEALKHIGVAPKYIKAGLQSTSLPLRMEVVSKHPLIILDGAHNQDKITSTVESTQVILKQTSKQRVHIVFGLSKDKKLDQILSQLLTLPIDSIACTRNTVNSLRLVRNPRDIANYIRKKRPDIIVESFLDPQDALLWSRQRTKKHDILLVTGSIFLSGELRPALVS
jgi:dihydrofolate synthase / folylpolyglutamate synthase